MTKNAYQKGEANNYKKNNFTPFIEKREKPKNGWLFCTKDAAKRIEGEGFLAFKSLSDKDLVIPTGSYTDFGHFIEKASDEEIHQYFKGICQVLSDRKPSNPRVVMNNGYDSGQEIFHLHAHFGQEGVIPEDENLKHSELQEKGNFFFSSSKRDDANRGDVNQNIFTPANRGDVNQTLFTPADREYTSFAKFIEDATEKEVADFFKGINSFRAEQVDLKLKDHYKIIIDNSATPFRVVVSSGERHEFELPSLTRAMKQRHDFAIESKNPNYEITIAETIGKRPHQQDAIFVGEVEDELAETNPAEFYKQNLPAIIDDHKGCSSGSTLSSAITKQNANGTIDITTANLGDSRVAVVLKYKKNGKVGYRSILLTEDHKPNLKRVKDHIESKGGGVSWRGVNNSLAVGGAIGDNNVLQGKEDCLLRTPDIWNFNSKNFLELGETLEDLDLIVSCDGLWDRPTDHTRIMATDTNFVLEEDKPTQKSVDQSLRWSHLTNLRKEFDELQDKSTYRNNFAYFLQQKALEGGSKDNISASNITLVSKGRVKIPKNKSVMLTVCDGHGGEPDERYEDNKDNLAGSKLVEAADDGALVAASVAARLANAAKITEISGLEIQKQKQESLFLLKQQYFEKPIIKTTNHQSPEDLIAVQSKTDATKKNNTLSPPTDEDEGHTTDEGESDNEPEVTVISQENIIKARNKTTYAYTDREIEAVNRARNIQEEISYFKNRKGEESGILFKNKKPLNGSDGVKTIIEMPACAVDQGSPIGSYLEAQLEHFKEFAEGKDDSNVYPVKILFPYKLQAWHWNVGEITLNKKDKDFSLEGCAYDSMNKEASLEGEIQKEISETFKKSFRGENFSTRLNKKSNSTQAPQKGGIACGLYAARAMHDLKTKAADKVWEDVLKDELALRNEDSDLVARHNPKSNFCLDERGFVNIFETKATRKLSPTNEAQSKPEQITTTDQQILDLKTTATEQQLKEGAALLEAFVVKKVNGEESDPQKLFDELNGNPLQKIVFNDEDPKKIKPTDQISNLTFEAVLIASEQTLKSSSTLNPQEQEYQECIELISGSYVNYVRKWAISCPSISEAFKKLDKSKKSEFAPTKEEKNLNHATEEIFEYISKKSLLSEKSKEDLREIALSASTLICAEVELARKSSVQEMQEGVKEMQEGVKMKDAQANNYETKIVPLIEKFAKSNNPIFEKDNKHITALEVAKEKFAKAKAGLLKKNKELKEELRELEKKSSKDKKEQSKLEAIKSIIEKNPEPTSEQKSAYNEKEILEYSAKGILSKALKVSIIEEIAKKDNEKDIIKKTITSPKLYERYARKNFIGDENDKIKFENEKFEGNSFANCTFKNCDFSAMDKKTLHFVNCTFDEGCVLPQNLENQNNNFAGCKFSAKIFDAIVDAEEKGNLKTNLGIDASKSPNNNFYEIAKPSNSISPSEVFKLSHNMLIR